MTSSYRHARAARLYVDRRTRPDLLRAALEAGYRSFDSAAVAGTEEHVGSAIKESGIPREELFVTTKLWNCDQGYGSALRAFDTSLAKLDVEYVDTPRRVPRPSKSRTSKSNITQAWQECGSGAVAMARTAREPRRSRYK
ncbi:aldo/keto reductase [Streptomyces rapamycinicus]|uniref:Aldo/keto reductase n=1 Tax=Streptomyces rhizosphaericus TaxID=114699 RepID=A0A6G4AWH5_9ACTN|nr:aldo/keto reductase [Streptomyces rhizosphaericus]